MTTGPVFIVGASRSGTAMLRSILNNSPELHIAGETHYFDDLRTALGDHGPRAALTSSEEQATQDYFLALAHRPYGHRGRADQSRMDSGALRRRAHALGNTGDAWFQAYCEEHARVEQRDPTPRWGEKTPRHIFRLQEMLDAFPDGQAVAMVRDPRAVAASYSNWSNQGGLDVDEDYVAALEAEEERARSSYDPVVSALIWRGGLRMATAVRDRMGHDRVRIQRYEDLVEEPAGQLRDIGDFLGLDTDPSMLDVPMHNSSFNEFEAGGGVSDSPLTRWKTVLDDRQVAVIQSWCRRDMERAGYGLQPVSLNLPARITTVARAGTSAIRAAMANRDRTGSLPAYLLRRARAALTR